MIRTDQLHIGYGSTLLSVEDLELTPGLYILVGKNGSGKSTFLKTITGAIPPVSGNVFVDDLRVGDIRPNELPKKIAFVSTHFPTVDFLRVHEYIALGRSPHTAYFGKLRAEDAVQMEQAMELIGITHLRDRFTNTLSDGERQLVAIARAFAQQTSVIALDEPTAFLDYTNKRRILEVLKVLATEHNKCIVLSSHDIDLSIEAGCPFLVVGGSTQNIELVVDIDKSKLLATAF